MWEIHNGKTLDRDPRFPNAPQIGLPPGDLFMFRGLDTPDTRGSYRQKGEAAFFTRDNPPFANWKQDETNQTDKL